MRVQVWIEDSQGAEVKVFDEFVGSDEQAELVREVVVRSLYLQHVLKGYVDTLGGDP